MTGRWQPIHTNKVNILFIRACRMYIMTSYLLLPMIMISNLLLDWLSFYNLGRQVTSSQSLVHPDQIISACRNCFVFPFLHYSDQVRAYLSSFQSEIIQFSPACRSKFIFYFLRLFSHLDFGHIHYYPRSMNEKLWFFIHGNMSWGSLEALNKHPY